MCACAHDNSTNILETLLEYDTVSDYLIAMETSQTSHTESNGEHFHFLVKMSDKHYKNYSERLFKKQLKLRGQAKSGKPRQYGKLREIHDLEAMAAYTMKDGNIISNMDSKQLEIWAEKSFKKDEEKEFRTLIYEYLDTIQPPETIHKDAGVLVNTYQEVPPNYLRIQLLGYFRENSTKVPNRNTLNSLVAGYMLYHAKYRYTLEDVDSWICGRN